MAVKIFYCYAPQDKELLDELKMHLSPLRRQGYILDLWSDSTIRAGTKWEEEIEERLNSANFVLLLISPNFIASDYCYEIGMKHAVARHLKGEASVIPIILQHCVWDNTPLAQLDLLPRSHIPVSDFHDPNEAFCDIAKEVRYRVSASLISTWESEANDLYKQDKYDEALVFYEKILNLAPNNLTAYVCKGTILSDLQRYQEALDMFDEAIKIWLQMKPSKEEDASKDQKYYAEALRIYQLALGQDLFHSPSNGIKREDVPKNTLFWEALVYLNRAIQHDPLNPFLHHFKGNVCFQLHEYKEAMGAYEQAFRLRPDLEQSRVYLSEAAEQISRQEYNKLNLLARQARGKAHQIRDEGLGGIGKTD